MSGGSFPPRASSGGRDFKIAPNVQEDLSHFFLGGGTRVPHARSGSAASDSKHIAEKRICRQDESVLLAALPLRGTAATRIAALPLT